MNKKLLTYILSNKKFVVSILILILFSVLFAQAIPYVEGLLVNNGIISENQEVLISLLIIILALLLLDTICKFILNLALFNFSHITAKNINRDVFKAIINKPFMFFERQNKGDILYRTNTYIYDIESYISRDIAVFVIGLARVLVIFAFLFIINLNFGLILVGFYLIIFLITLLISPRIIRKAKTRKDKELFRNSIILQNIEGMETFLAYNTSAENLGFYSEINSEYSRVRKKFYTSYNFIFPLIDFLVCLGTVLIYVLAFFGSMGALEIGALVAVLSYTTSMMTPMQDVAKGLSRLLDISATLDEVMEMLGQPNQNAKKINKNAKEINQNAQKENKKVEKEINKSINLSSQDEFKAINLAEDFQNENKVLPAGKIDIKCEKVCFKSLTSETEIKNLSMDIAFGEKVLIYGAYGSGKTLFADLISGLIQVSSGAITFNGVNINNLSREEITNIISSTSDSVGIFKASVFENVKFAKPTASNAEILSAIEASGLKKAMVAEEIGVSNEIIDEIISEGDKQLLSLARVLLKNTPILIVDEATRDLEENKRKKFMQVIKKFAKNKTLIFISEEKPAEIIFDKEYHFISPQ